MCYRLDANTYTVDLFNDRIDIYYGVLDILLAAVYDYRTTAGESTAESPWTVCKLSAHMSCLETFHSVNNVLTSFLRRGLVYPLYRHWELLQLCVRDACTILRVGKRAVLKLLLHVKPTLCGDGYWRYCRYWIDDYCLWLQLYARFVSDCVKIVNIAEWYLTDRDDKFLAIAKQAKSVKIGKADVGFGLEEWERLAAEIGDSDDENDGSDSDATTSSSSSMESEQEQAEVELPRQPLIEVLDETTTEP